MAYSLRDLHNYARGFSSRAGRTKGTGSTGFRSIKGKYPRDFLFCLSAILNFSNKSSINVSSFNLYFLQIARTPLRSFHLIQGLKVLADKMKPQESGFQLPSFFTRLSYEKQDTLLKLLILSICAVLCKY